MFSVDHHPIPDRERMENSEITILIVDDTAANLQVLTSIVTSQGYNILLAQSGSEALEAADTYLPDVILLDIMMPGMDGFEVCRLLKEKERTRQIPVIFVTARTDVDAVEKGFDVGGDDYVSKPFNDRELLARLKTHVERYKLQRDIIREHALMTSVLEDSPIMFCRFDGKRRLEYANQAFQFWFGTEFAHLQGEDLLKHFPGRRELDFLRHLDTISLYKQSDTRTFSSTGQDGEPHYIQWTYRGIFNRNNEVVAYQCFGKDVTEQELMFRKLNERNILLEHSQIAGKMMNWEMDPETHVISFENEISRIIEGAGKIFELQELYDVVHPEDLQELKEHIREYAGGNSPMTSFFRVTVDDVQYSLRIHAFYEKDTNGRIVAYRGIVQDISELHRRQRELLLSRERLNTAFDAAQIGTFTLHFPGRKWKPDKQLQRLYNIKKTGNALMLEDWFALVHEEDSDMMRKSMEQCLKSDINTCEFEFRVPGAGDQLKWFRCSTQVIERKEDGTPSLIMGVSIDITREHEMLDTIKRQEENLAQSRKLRAMGQLTGGIAHDFNNMLATILGFAELLSEELQDDEELSYYCKNITDTCERAATLTNQLLTFSRKQRKQSTAIDVHDLVINSIALIRHALPRSVVIKQDLRAREHYIMGEFAQLQNVLLNLAFNAKDAMPEGGEFRLITENTSVYERDLKEYPVDIEPGNYIVLRVKDNGVGMDKELLSKIFEPFFTTKSAGEGTGLGLSSVYGTVYAHNGYIYADSTPGEGTTFNILFPVSPLKPQKSKAAAEDLSSVPLSGGYVLVVDDEEPIRQMLKKSLTYIGFQVLEASSGKEGIELYVRHRSDIRAVILDVIMPGMDGVAVYRELQKIDPEVTVIISSGFANNEQSNALKNMGAKAHLRKPYRQSDLVSALKKSLAGPA